MKSYLSFFVLVAALFVAGCDKEARVGTRNLAEVGKHLQTKLDPETQVLGRVIEVEATAVANNLDASWVNTFSGPSEPTVTVEDFAADPQKAIDGNLEQTKKIQDDTNVKLTFNNYFGWAVGTIMSLLGLEGLRRGGSWVIRLQRYAGTAKKVMSAMTAFSKDLEKAETDTEVEKLKEVHKAKQIEAGIHDAVKAELDAAKKSGDTTNA